MIIVKIDVMNSPSARRKQANPSGPNSGRTDAIRLSRIETNRTDRNTDLAVERSIKKSSPNGPYVPIVIRFRYGHAGPFAPPRNQAE